MWPVPPVLDSAVLENPKEVIVNDNIFLFTLYYKKLQTQSRVKSVTEPHIVFIQFLG